MKPGDTKAWKTYQEKYVLEFLNHILVGIAEIVAVGESISVVQMRHGEVVP